MNTIPTTASTNTILAIDLGKYKSVACVHDQATGEFGLWDRTPLLSVNHPVRSGVLTHALADPADVFGAARVSLPWR